MPIYVGSVPARGGNSPLKRSAVLGTGVAPYGSAAAVLPRQGMPPMTWTSLCTPSNRYARIRSRVRLPLRSSDLSIAVAPSGGGRTHGWPELVEQHTVDALLSALGQGANGTGLRRPTRRDEVAEWARPSSRPPARQRAWLQSWRRGPPPLVARRGVLLAIGARATHPGHYRCQQHAHVPGQHRFLRKPD